MGAISIRTDARSWPAGRLIKGSATMRFFISVMALFTVLSSARADETHVQLPYKVAYGGWLTVEVLVNGEGPYDFIIDTGATNTLVFQKLNDIHEFEPSGGPPQRVLGTGSSETFLTFIIGDLTIGAAQLNDVVSVILTDWRVGKASPFGVIGLDFLSRYALSFDVEAGVLTLSDGGIAKPKGWTSAPLKRRDFGLEAGDLFTVTARLNNRSTELLVDLGATGTIINAPAYGSVRRAPGVSIRPSGGDARQRVTDSLDASKIARRIRLRRFSIGRTNWYSQEFTVYDAPIFVDLGRRGVPFGLLGSDLFKDRSFVLDFLEDRMFIGPKAD